MVTLKMIKTMPDFPAGLILDMNNKEGAQMWVDEGYAIYWDRKNNCELKTKNLVKIKNKSQKNEIKMKYNNIYEEIISRMKASCNPCYLNIFGADDQKKKKHVSNDYFNLHSCDISEILAKIKSKNIDTFGVFMNFNALNKDRRINENVNEILYIFIDLDHAEYAHNTLIKQNLKAKNIKYSYNAQSGGGYHFLIPVSMQNIDKSIVKGFLEYFKLNVCDKVDVATHTNERLIRCPESIHNKIEGKPFPLQTLEYIQLSDMDIEKNTEIIKKYQEINIKGEREEKYLININRVDTFFSTILYRRNDWNLYINYLKNSKNRNDNFIKNLGFYLATCSEHYVIAEDFLKLFEPARITHVKGWIKKAENNNLKVNYYELLKWSKENKLDDFISLLEEQLNHKFLDDYEFYYLEDEKSDSNILLYYPEKNYYVQKSMQEVLINIYYNCKESGIDLVSELNLIELNPKWNEFSFKRQLTCIIDQMKRIIEQENRVRLVFNINYKPTNEKIIYEENTKKKYFNIYNKTNLWDFYKKSNNYNFPNIKELIMNLCGEDEKSYTWFLKWLSYIIKNPTEKLPTAVILQGKQGSGKGTLRNLIFDKIFGNNCIEINQTHLESSFNDYLLGKQIIFANEVMHNDNRQTLPNILKNYVTDPELTINIKFKKPISSKNYTHWIFCTNSDNPIKIEEDDRRYSVFYSQKLRKGLGKSLRENLDYEMQDFISFLKDLDVKFEEVEEPIYTKAKEDIIDLNRDSISMFQEYISQFNNIYDCYVSLYNDAITIHITDEQTAEDYVLTDVFYSIYQKYCENFREKGVFKKQTFSKKLSMYGIISHVKNFNENSKRCYSLQDIKTKFMKKEKKVNQTTITDNLKVHSCMLDIMNFFQDDFIDLNTIEKQFENKHNKLTITVALDKLKQEAQIFEPRKNSYKKI
jgi:hypothetical protein